MEYILRIHNIIWPIDIIVFAYKILPVRESGAVCSGMFYTTE